MRLLCTLLWLALAAAPLRAWDNGGHEIVCAIAYAHLNPKAKQAVDQLAAQVHSSHGAYDAITIGCWMDDIRTDTTLADYGRFKSWHYIDIPLDPRDPTPDFVPGTDNDVHGNAVQALRRAFVVLDGGTDPYIRDKPTALAMVEHLVGDIHQPLHCATKYFFSHGQRRDDKGGNDEFVLNGPPGDTKFNLHAFWDTAWRASFDQSTGNVVLAERFHPKTRLDPESVRDLANEVMRAFDREAKEQKGPATMDIKAMALQSNALARDVVYPGITATDNAKYCRLSSAYVAQARDLARHQLALAGIRLAALLNDFFDGDNSLPVPASWPAGPPGG
jgi:hypothetical protein